MAGKETMDNFGAYVAFVMFLPIPLSIILTELGVISTVVMAVVILMSSISIPFYVYVWKKAY